MNFCHLLITATLISVLPSNSRAETPTSSQPVSATHELSTIDRAECDAEAEKSYPSYVIGVGKKRKELISLCLSKRSSPSSTKQSEPADRVECEAEAAKVYPPQIWGVGKKRKSQFSACMIKRGWAGK